MFGKNKILYLDYLADDIIAAEHRQLKFKRESLHRENGKVVAATVSISPTVSRGGKIYNRLVLYGRDVGANPARIKEAESFFLFLPDDYAIHNHDVRSSIGIGIAFSERTNVMKGMFDALRNVFTKNAPVTTKIDFSRFTPISPYRGQYSAVLQRELTSALEKSATVIAAYLVYARHSGSSETTVALCLSFAAAFVDEPTIKNCAQVIHETLPPTESVDIIPIDRQQEELVRRVSEPLFRSTGAA